MKNIKKSIFTACAALLILMLSACGNSANEVQKIVGKWVDVKTEQVYEYTSDGYFYEYANENFTYDKTHYRIDGNKIYYYLDGAPETEFSVEYKFDGDNLVIEDEIIYAPLVIKTREDGGSEP